MAFPVGGLVDMVRPGATGWLAAESSSEALTAAVRQALSDLAGGLDLRGDCRRTAEAEFDVRHQAGRYVALFRELGARR